MPHELSPWQTVHDCFWQWRDDGTLKRFNTALRERVRAVRDPSPSAGIIGSQSAKTTEMGSVATTAASR